MRNTRLSDSQGHLITLHRRWPQNCITDHRLTRQVQTITELSVHTVFLYKSSKTSTLCDNPL